jgi:hypothetical protein
MLNAQCSMRNAQLNGDASMLNPRTFRWALGIGHWALKSALTLVFASTASATVLIPAEFSEMVAASDLVVHGRIVSLRGQTTGDRRAIETLVTVSVMEALKGDPGSTVYFRVPNGQVGRYRRIMIGAPEFADGEEVILFLAGRAPALPMPFGLSQGVYRVNRSSSGQSLVTPLMVAEAPGRVVRGDPARRPVDIEVFARRVREIVERQR